MANRPLALTTTTTTLYQKLASHVDKSSCRFDCIRKCSLNQYPPLQNGINEAFFLIVTKIIFNINVTDEKKERIYKIYKNGWDKRKCRQLIKFILNIKMEILMKT